MKQKRWGSDVYFDKMPGFSKKNIVFISIELGLSDKTEFPLASFKVIT